jgi:hypothetical protein
MGVRKVKPRKKVKALVQIGQKFGYLTFLGFPADDPKCSKNRGIFKCDCGKTKELWFSNVVHGYQKSCCGLHAKKWSYGFGVTQLNLMYKALRAIATARKMPCEFTKEEYAIFVAQPCHYCGSPAPYKKGLTYKGGIYANGIDRVDNSKGYTKENSVPCCKTCNFAKRNMPVEEFLRWVKRVYEHSLPVIAKL